MWFSFRATTPAVWTLLALFGFTSAAEAQFRFHGSSSTRTSFSRNSGSPGFSFTVRRPFAFHHGVYRGYPRSFGRFHRSYGGLSFGFCPGCGGYGSLCRCRGPLVLPPLFVDASGLYGPRGLFGFFGVNNARPAAPRARPAVAAGDPPVGLLPPARRAPIRQANAGARGRAWKFIDYGDRHFKEGRYREALSRYRKASSSYANLGTARFRIGFAHLALGNIDRAALEIRRGLQLDPTWPDSEFVLEDLFTRDAAREAAFRTLSNQLKELPNDGEARLLAGVLLHFDGDPAAAEKQFRRVMQIAGDDQAAKLFLPQPAEELGDAQDAG